MITLYITIAIITHASAALLGIILANSNRRHHIHTIQILREYIRATIHEADTHDGHISHFTRTNGKNYYQASDPEA